jgi:hypothetical protein
MLPPVQSRCNGFYGKSERLVAFCVIFAGAIKCRTVAGVGGVGGVESVWGPPGRP